MENSESKNNKNGLWNFLFGKKKKNAFQKKNNCNRCENCQGEKKDKTVQTNNYSDGKEDEDIPILNINTYSNPKEMQKNKDCPGKVFPSERRGCGFHLYFCIDSMQRSDISKSKKTKNAIYEINKAEDFQSLGQRSAAGDNDVNSTSGQPSSPVKYHASNTSILNKKLNLSGTNMSHNENLSDQLKSTTIKIEENEIEKEINTSPKIQEENKLLNNRNIRRVGNTSTSSAPVNGEQTGKVPAVRISSVEKLPETQNLKNGEKGQINCPKSFILPDHDEEAVFKGLDILRKQKLRRKSSMRSKTGSIFVRNSLISVRKDTVRRSSIDTMVPQILLKLSNIEDKIAELEKVYEDKGKNIMNIVGISCNNAKSTLSIDVKDQDGKKDTNKQSSPETSPKTNTTVVIKSRGEDIVVNAPENISVTKKRNKQESNQLIYHNTQELDAHSIASYSRTIKSQKPKSDVEASSQAMEFTNSQASDKWRRISEELKFN